MPQLPEGAFGRMDETPDEEFYRTPRLVTHIDGRAIFLQRALHDLDRAIDSGAEPAGRGDQHLEERTLVTLPPGTSIRRLTDSVRAGPS